MISFFLLISESSVFSNPIFNFIGPVCDYVNEHYPSLPQSFRLFDCVTSKERDFVLKTSDFNTLLSSYEGFGLSVIEARSLGTPSLLFDIPIFREISSSCDFLLPYSNSPSLLFESFTHKLISRMSTNSPSPSSTTHLSPCLSDLHYSTIIS